MGRGVKIFLITLIVVSLLVLMITLLAVSIQVIANDELGIKYHKITKKITSERVYEEGRYTLTPGETFFKFKRRYVTIDDTDVLCLTQDGLEAQLDISFQYRLNQSELISFYKLYGSGYEDIIALLARTATRDACGNWTSEGFYYARERVQQDMASRMQTAFDTIHVEAGFLQLSNVALPTEFQTVVRSTQEAKQDSEQASNERNEELTKAQTEVLQAEKTATILAVNAQADAYGIDAKASADAEAITAELTAQKETYSSVMVSLGLSAEELINYISLQTIQNSEGSVISVESPVSFVAAR